ncbi:hypothetical protein EVAR_50030_1, partial [Eumeta japonica]
IYAKALIRLREGVSPMNEVIKKPIKQTESRKIIKYVFTQELQRRSFSVLISRLAAAALTVGGDGDAPARPKLKYGWLASEAELCYPESEYVIRFL